MERIAAVVAERRDDLARTLTLDQGKPLKAEAYDEVDELEQYWLMAAADARRLEGLDAAVRGRGQAGARLPRAEGRRRRDHAVELAVHDAGGGDRARARGRERGRLGAGADDVGGGREARRVHRRGASLPAGVFNMVTGQGAVVGDEVAGSADTHAIGFIGSITTGYKVAERAAGKSLLLEMGGNGPVVVLEDADLDKAVAATLVASFLCAGQSCTAGERFLVHESVHDAYLDKLAAAMAKEIRLGDPFADDTTMGPLNNEPVAEKMDRHIGDAVERGAEVVAGGSRAEGYPTGLYYEPTVLDRVTHDMEVSTEETFGPIVPISTITGEEEALALIDASPYGLLTSVFTQDLRRGLRFAESARAGWVNVNESSNYWESHLPFGGRAGSRSGIGRVGGRHPFETFTETKTVIVEI